MGFISRTNLVCGARVSRSRRPGIGHMMDAGLAGRGGAGRGGALRAMRLGKLAACGGVAGPVVFTAAWVVSSLRQAGHPAAGIQLSGLAAEDARDPQIMMAALVVLGICAIALG